MTICFTKHPQAYNINTYELIIVSHSLLHYIIGVISGYPLYINVGGIRGTPPTPSLIERSKRRLVADVVVRGLTSR